MSNPYFTSDRIGMLRHAQIVTQPGEAILHGHSRDHLEMVCSQLSARIPQTNVIIFYSPAKSTDLTAREVSGKLEKEEKTVNLLELEWLTSLEVDLLDNPRSGVEKRFENLLEANPHAFLLFVAHQNGISAFANIPSGRIQNCSFFAREFSLDGHDVFEDRSC